MKQFTPETNWRRTKIVCTLGPASGTPDVIGRLLDAGMNVARINMSHGDQDHHAAAISAVRREAKKRGIHVPIMMDLAGPKMRIGALPDGQVSLSAGEKFTLTAGENAAGDRIVSVNYAPLLDDLERGDRVLMGDGEIELRVEAKRGDDVVCDVVVGGVLKSHKGINAPGVRLREEVPTVKDLDNVRFGLDVGVDWFALSFVRFPREVERLREFLNDHDTDVPIVVKLEKKESLQNIDEILEVAGAVMVARGDLGLEIPIAEVPLVQKDIISKAVAAGRPVITATQMLESMIERPRPTRAEAADVANAIFDGTDAVMLSGETAAGNFPVQAVATMADIAVASEERIDYADLLSHRQLHHDVSVAAAIGRSACGTAVEIGARAILCCTRSGQTARMVSRFRPPMPIVAVSPNESTLRRVGLYWNTFGVPAPFQENVDDMVDAAKSAALETELVAKGDRVIVVAGVPISEPGTTNVIKVDMM
ncbi:MAG: pyruvate kinase [Candidatus Latescibacterota bacterium]